MQVWVRLFHVGWRALRQSGTADAGFRSSLFFRVAPGDLDVNLHMNNGRYLTVMDLGRIDILIRTGLWRQMRRQGWRGVVANQRIRYRHALGPWDRFRLDSRILGWNDDGVIFAHRMTRIRRDEEKLAAAAAVRFVFTHRSPGKPRTADILASVGITGDSPPLAEELAAWLQVEKRLASTRGAD
jgi:acyl-CoA thioesterase FadM